MSVEGKHAYRFGFLKSEKWKSLRLELLVKWKGKCAMCGKEAHDNDVHHTKYPERWENTSKSCVVVLCRGCHSTLHSLWEDGKIPQMDSGSFMIILKEIKSKQGTDFTAEDFMYNMALIRTATWRDGRLIKNALQNARRKISQYLLTQPSNQV